MTMSTSERRLLAELEAESESEWENAFEEFPEIEEMLPVNSGVPIAAPAAAYGLTNLPGRAWDWLTTPDSTQRRIALGATKEVLTKGIPAFGAVAGNVLGGPVAGAGGVALGSALGGGLASLLPQREYEYEFESELEGALNRNQQRYTDALMEYLGYAAATAQSEAEAEAFIGALLPLAAQLIPQVAPAMMSAAPNLISGLAAATRNLRRSPNTRPLVQTMPTIVRGTAASMNRQLAQGIPVTPQTAVKSLARQTYGVLSSPQRSVHALRRSQAMNQRYQQMVAPLVPQEGEAEYFDSDAVLSSFRRGHHWQGVDFNITPKQVYQLLANATRSRREIARKARALLDEMSHKSWTITAGGHAGGLGGGGFAADPNPHITINVGGVSYHLQYLVKKGRIILRNITP